MCDAVRLTFFCFLAVVLLHFFIVLHDAFVALVDVFRLL